MNKKYLYMAIPLMAFAVIGVVSAASNTFGVNSPMSKLATAIAEKFNLNVTDVQEVVDQVFQEQRDEMEAKKEEVFTGWLNQAVLKGKLTQEQADKILAKKAELETQRESWQNMTPEERQAAMKEQMDSLKQWAADNNIPQGYLMFGGFRMGGCRCGSGFGKPINEDGGATTQSI